MKMSDDERDLVPCAHTASGGDELDWQDRRPTMRQNAWPAPLKARCLLSAACPQAERTAAHPRGGGGEGGGRNIDNFVLLLIDNYARRKFV